VLTRGSHIGQDHLVSTRNRTVEIGPTPPAGGGRVAALDRLRDLDPADAAWEAELSAVSLALVDAILHSDVEALEAASDPLRDALARLFEDAGHAREIRGWLLGMLAFTEWSLQRLPSAAELELAQDSHARLFLEALSNSEMPLSSGELKGILDTDDSQLSRLGRKLLGRGVVVQRRVGRTARWELTPRGRQLLRQAQEPHSPAAQGAGKRRRAR
jgi:hypothetical protein